MGEKIEGGGVEAKEGGEVGEGKLKSTLSLSLLVPHSSPLLSVHGFCAAP